jgi:cytochrome b561
MLFGIVITRTILISGGVVLLALILFQVMQGKRKIKFKGPLHMKVHRWSAYAIIVLAVLHALAGLVYVNVVRL